MMLKCAVHSLCKLLDLKMGLVQNNQNCVYDQVEKTHNKCFCLFMSLHQWRHKVLFLWPRIIRVLSSLFDPQWVLHLPFLLNLVFGRAANKKTGFAGVMSLTLNTEPLTP